MRKIAIPLLVLMFSSAPNLCAQQNLKDQIQKVIIDSYVHGLIDGKDFNKAREGIHENFEILGHRDDSLTRKTRDQWIEQRKKRGNLPPVDYQVEYIDIDGDAANAKIRMKRSDIIATDYVFLYKFSDGWKIVSAIDNVRRAEPIEIGEVFTIYEIPYLNDHSIIYNPDEKKWHLFGIEYPQTQFIHLTADSLTQRGWIKQKPFTAGGAEIWAPHIICHEGKYHMYYTSIGVPREIHHVVSEDLYEWSVSSKPVLALSNEKSKNLKNKDPMVFRDELNNQWIMYYSIMKDDKHWVVGYSTSTDLFSWSEPGICFDEHTESPGVESPFVVKRGDYYYLFLSARPWPVGGEDIFRSKSPFSWETNDLVKRIDPWHAAELIQDLNGKWYLSLSSGTKAQNLRLAPLFWH